MGQEHEWPTGMRKDAHVLALMPGTYLRQDGSRDRYDISRRFAGIEATS